MSKSCKWRNCDSLVHGDYEFCAKHNICRKSKCQKPVDFVNRLIYCEDHANVCNKNSSCKKPREEGNAYCKKHHLLVSELRKRKRLDQGKIMKF